MEAKVGRAVFAGRFQGQSVVIKFIWKSERAEQDTRSAWTELTEAWPRMNKGPYRVPQPVFSDPPSGVLVMSRALGKRLDHALKSTKPKGRAHLVTQAGHWLDTFTQTRRRRVPFASTFWLTQHEQRLETMQDPDLRQLGRMLTNSLARQSPRLHHQNVTQVRPHGDFWVENLLWDGHVMTGVDLQHTTWHPVAKDVARFLTHLSLLLPSDRGPWCHGLPREWVSAMGTCGILSAEPDSLLRFFIGVELSRRLVAEGTNTSALNEAKRCVERYVADESNVP